MNQESSRISNLVDTTDCLEAISVIRCWKNLLFIIIFLALLFLQVSFLLVDLKLVEADEVGPGGKAVAGVSEAGPSAEGETSLTGGSLRSVSGPQPVPDKIMEAAKEAAVAEPNQPATTAATDKKSINFSLVLKEKHIKAVVRFLNFLLIPASLIYCLTMLFALKVSFIGRLGGINHITRAFFLSLLFVILLLPWQLLFAPVFAGAMWTPTELINACAAVKTRFAYACLYLRFTGYWLLVMLLLLFAQTRSMRWTKATLRRLEVV